MWKTLSVGWVSAALIGCSGAYLIAWYRQTVSLALYWTPPGAIPVLGHGLQIGLSANPENPVVWMAEQSKINEYKPWIARLLLFDCLLVVPDAQMISEILANSEDFPRSYHFDTDKLLFGGDILAAIHGSVWKLRRKIMNPFFANNKQKNILSIVKELAIKATKKIDDYSETGEVFDLYVVLKALTCDVICRFIFGKDFGCLDGDQLDYGGSWLWCAIE